MAKLLVSLGLLICCAGEISGKKNSAANNDAASAAVILETSRSMFESPFSLKCPDGYYVQTFASWYVFAHKARKYKLICKPLIAKASSCKLTYATKRNGGFTRKCDEKSYVAGLESNDFGDGDRSFSLYCCQSNVVNVDRRRCRQTSTSMALAGITQELTGDEVIVGMRSNISYETNGPDRHFSLFVCDAPGMGKYVAEQQSVESSAPKSASSKDTSASTPVDDGASASAENNGCESTFNTIDGSFCADGESQCTGECQNIYGTSNVGVCEAAADDGSGKCICRSDCPVVGRNPDARTAERSADNSEEEGHQQQRHSNEDQEQEAAEPTESRQVEIENYLQRGTSKLVDGSCSCICECQCKTASGDQRRKRSSDVIWHNSRAWRQRRDSSAPAQNREAPSNSSTAATQRVTWRVLGVMTTKAIGSSGENFNTEATRKASKKRVTNTPLAGLVTNTPPPRCPPCSCYCSRAEICTTPTE